MKKIKNLQDFLAHVGGDTPYQAGRGIYKYTDCGPWITYLVEETPEQSVSLEVTVHMKDGKLHASCAESIFDYENERAPEVLGLLGFHPDGTGDKIGRSVAAYRRKVEEFIGRKVAKGEATAAIGDSNAPYTLTLYPQRPTELGCRPAPKAVNILMHRIEKPTYEEVYYESDRGNAMLDKCIGIKMGSIVEGSEAYVDREPMMFPFSGKEFDEYVKSINDEACFYWDRDNIDHYTVEDGKKEYYITSGWGSESKLPKKLQGIVNEFLQANDIEDDEAVTIPNTKVVITKIPTDCWAY